MKFLVVGDLHLRHNPPLNRTKEFYNDLLNKIKEINDIQKQYNVDYVFCLGDVFDNYIEDYIEKIIYDISDYVKGWYFLIGNHDCKEKSGDIRGTSFGLLYKTGIVNINPPTSNNYNFDFYHYYNRNDFYEKHTFDSSKINIAFIHDYILPQSVSEYEKIECKVCENLKTDYKYVFAGHYHYSYDIVVNNTRYINPGSLLRKTIAQRDAERKVKVILFDDTNKENPIYEIYLQSCRDTKDVYINIQDNDKDKKEFDSEFTKKLQNINLVGNSMNDLIYLLQQNKVENEIINYIKSINV